MSSDWFKLHVIDQRTGKKLADRRIIGCPRVGDEIRLSVDKYVVVRRVIWCLDEPTEAGQRVNLGVDPLP